MTLADFAWLLECLLETGQALLAFAVLQIEAVLLTMPAELAADLLVHWEARSLVPQNCRVPLASPTIALVVLSHG